MKVHIAVSYDFTINGHQFESSDVPYHYHGFPLVLLPKVGDNFYDVRIQDMIDYVRTKGLQQGDSGLTQETHDLLNQHYIRCNVVKEVELCMDTEERDNIEEEDIWYSIVLTCTPTLKGE